jgi:hypothetical protein
MSYYVLIRDVGELLDSEDVHAEISDADDENRVISDLAAKTIASWWHSPGTDGQNFSRLSHGFAFQTDDLLRDIDRELSNLDPQGPDSDIKQAALELMALRSWVEHWTGNHLPVHVAVPAADEQHCKYCGQRIKRVQGGQGMTWAHTDSGAVAAPNPPEADRG